MSTLPVRRVLLKHHAAAGYALASYYLRDHRCLSAIVARDHHERRDGSGYPRGGCVDDLMVEIVVVADVFDAFLSPRPYRPEPFEPGERRLNPSPTWPRTEISAGAS